jgi:hypothetical protein
MCQAPEPILVEYAKLSSDAWVISIASQAANEAGYGSLRATIIWLSGGRSLACLLLAIKGAVPLVLDPSAAL